jgi:transcription termination/antitermination protein NusG
MCTSSQYASFRELPAVAALGAAAEVEEWFAVQTRPRHEKVVAQEVRDRGVTAFLPLVREVRGWSDRRKVVELPLFSCYIFVKLALRNDERLRVLRLNGALRFVGAAGVAIPIPDEQILAVQSLLEQHLPFSSHPFLKIGQRVRVRSGALSGVEGILVARSGERTLVVSLNAIQRSLSVRIEGYDVEPI